MRNSPNDRPFVDSIPLMRQLAAMANMDLAFIKRMVLVVEIDAAPTLYVESFLSAEKELTLVDTPLHVEQKAVTVKLGGEIELGDNFAEDLAKIPHERYIDTTTMLNEKVRTKMPKD